MLTVGFCLNLECRGLRQEKFKGILFCDKDLEELKDEEGRRAGWVVWWQREGNIDEPVEQRAEWRGPEGSAHK